MHVHSKFSPDGISSMDEQCIEAIRKGVSIICFTDHVDYNTAEKNMGYVKDNTSANFDVTEYFYEIERLRIKYPNLKILSGIEFSEPHLFRQKFEEYSKLPFDYILGSIHHCYDSVFPGAANLPEPQAIFEYYDLMIQSIKECSFNGIAHIDFPRIFFDEWNIGDQKLDYILRLIIENDIALEVNTSSLNKECVIPMPTWDIIKRFSELGGCKIVLGSDAHESMRLAYDFEMIIPNLPKSLVVGYYEKRVFTPLK